MNVKKLNMDYIIKETWYKVNTLCSALHGLIQELSTLEYIAEHENQRKFPKVIKELIKELIEAKEHCLNALEIYEKKYQKRLHRLVFSKKRLMQGNL